MAIGANRSGLDGSGRWIPPCARYRGPGTAAWPTPLQLIPNSAMEGESKRLQITHYDTISKECRTRRVQLEDKCDVALKVFLEFAVFLFRLVRFQKHVTRCQFRNASET